MEEPAEPGIRPGEATEENTLDERIRQMIRELEQALSGAFADSEDVHELLRRLRDEGYGLVIAVDRREGRGPAAGPARLSGPAGAAGSPPSFRIDAADLAFLRSIGIDPTRKIRGRRASRSVPPGAGP